MSEPEIILAKNNAPIGAEAWPQRKPLPGKLPAVPTMPEDLLPAAFRPWIADATQRLQVPPDFIAVPAIIAAASVIGRTVGIHPKERDDWLVVPNLWGAIVGRPGVMKTPALNEGLRHLERLASKARDAHKEGAALAGADREILQAKIRATKGQVDTALKSESPGAENDVATLRTRLAELNKEAEAADTSERRYIVNDPTVEAVGKLLNENPRGLLLMRDELIGLLKSLDRQDRAQDRAFYCESWNGVGGFTVDRIGRGTVHVPALTLSIVGGMTPGKLASYVEGALSGGEADDGLLQRFQLATWPDVSPAWEHFDHYPDASAKAEAFGVFERLDTLDPAAVGAVADDGEIPALRFAPDAQVLFNDWRGELEKRLRGDQRTPAFESHIGKYRSLMPSLALIFHLIDNPSAGFVGLEAARLAARWCEYLEGHARRIYAPEMFPEVTAAHLIVERIAAGAIEDGCTVRDLYSRDWSGLSEARVVIDGLRVLQDCHAVRVVEEKTAGRPRSVIRFHPELRQAA